MIREDNRKDDQGNIWPEQEKHRGKRNQERKEPLRKAQLRLLKSVKGFFWIIFEYPKLKSIFNFYCFIALCHNTIFPKR